MEGLPFPPLLNPSLSKSATDPVPSKPLLAQPAAPTPLARSQSDGSVYVEAKANAATSSKQSHLIYNSLKKAFPPAVAHLVPAPLALPALLRSSSQVAQFYCQICLCNEKLTAAYSLEPCGHRFCRECISQYLKIKIDEAQINNFLCPYIDDSLIGGSPDGWTCAACSFFNTPAPSPGTSFVTCSICDGSQPAPPAPEEPGCRTLILDSDLSAVLDDAPKAKLARFTEMRRNANFRECPRCQFPNTVGPSSFSNRLTCGECIRTEAVEAATADAVDEEKGEGSSSGCAHVYCFVHSDQHHGESCKQFERRHRQEEAAAAAFISKFARPCPGCKQPIEKNGGCNHMTCPNPACRCNFCWLCGRKISGGTLPSHFADWNVLGCPAMQMQADLRSAGRSNRSQEAIQCAYRVAYACFIPIAAALVFTIVLSFFIAFGVFGIAWFVAFGAISVLVLLPCVMILARFQTETRNRDAWEYARTLPLFGFTPLMGMLFICGGWESD
jgi:hypothetical protein